MASAEDVFSKVKRLSATGLSDYRVAAITGVPRPTVTRWRGRTDPPARGRNAIRQAWTVPDPAMYCYLLGAYLGDGSINHRSPNGWTLRVTCDQLYPLIIDEVLRAMETTFPGGQPTRWPASKALPTW